MTDRDKFELPPIPTEERFGDTYGEASMRDYGRDCFMAGLATARAEPAKPTEPEAHSAYMVLTRDGYAWCSPACPPPKIITAVTLCWTADGRAWIDSERNRELARRLRYGNGYADIPQTADALDGGVR